MGQTKVGETKMGETKMGQTKVGETKMGQQKLRQTKFGPIMGQVKVGPQNCCASCGWRHLRQRVIPHCPLCGACWAAFVSTLYMEAAVAFKEHFFGLPT